MARKPWSELSPAYRRRLERAGIGPDTPHGARAAARGHAKTPEHPERAVKNPARYRDYLQNSTSLIDRVIAHKEYLWGSDHKYRPRRAIQAVISPERRRENGGGKVENPSRKTMRDFLKMTLADVENLGDWYNDDDWVFLFYH